MNGIVERKNAKRYVPKLANLQATCAANYGRLMRLLPDIDQEALTFRFGVSQSLHYQIRILQCEAYTTTLEMRQCGSESDNYMQPVMQVRLYHDARMAEVLGFQKMGRFRASYPYPNGLMHQPNEKEQVNHFLAEWLSFCLKHLATEQDPI